MQDEGEIVYVLINEAMPGYTKLGRTSNLEKRIRNLDNTAVPLPFECFYAARVNDAAFVERQLHDAFDDHRVRSNREFFQIDPERLASALRIAEIEDVTPRDDVVESEEDLKALDKARKRRSVFNFDMVQVPVGAELTFARDPSISCRVIDARRIEFEAEVTSLSAAASTVLARMGNSWGAVQGPLYWEYEGETLAERRLRMESGEE